MNFFIVPSLEHIAIVSISSTILKQPDVKENMRKWIHFLKGSPSAGTYEVPIQQVLDKVWRLPLPTRLQKCVQTIMMPMEEQMESWIDHHNTLFPRVDFSAPQFIDNVYFSSLGIIDKKRTAELILKQCELNTVSAFTLACYYCIEQELPSLWEHVPSEFKERFSVSEKVLLRKSPQLVYWACYFKRHVSRLAMLVRQQYAADLYIFLLKKCCYFDSVSVFRYFWEKISNETRRNLMSELAGDAAVRSEPSIFFFLLSRLTLEQQIEVFQRYPNPVLKCVLRWPWIDLFSLVAKYALPVLNGHDFVAFLSEVLKEIGSYGDNEYLCRSYQRTLSEAWQYGTLASRRFVTGRRISRCNEFLLHLFLTGDTTNVTLVLRDATVDERKQILLSELGYGFCAELIVRESFEDFHNLISENLFPEEIEDFKTEFYQEHGNRICAKLSPDGHITEQSKKFLNWSLGLGEEVRRLDDRQLIPVSASRRSAMCQ